MDVVAMKRMEDFAKTMLDASPAQQKKVWEALEHTLTQDEISGLKKYVGLFHMFTDQRLYDAVKKSVSEQLYNELHK